MGSRGSFISVESGNFNFRINGQTFKTIGEVDGVQVIVKTTKESVAAPEISHSPNRTYAIIQNGMLKYIAYYDKNHNQIKSVDFGHKHHERIPHVHYNLNHTEDGGNPTNHDLELAKKISRRFNVKWKK